VWRAAAGLHSQPDTSLKDNKSSDSPVLLPTAAASGEGLMTQTFLIIIVALFAGALTPPSQETLAAECCVGGFAKPAAYSSSRIRAKGWIELHRPDGQLVHIQVVQILYVTSAKNAGANERAQARVQLTSGFADVLESVDEVMRSIADDNSIA
jgi:hypothetical protein